MTCRRTCLLALGAALTLATACGGNGEGAGGTSSVENPAGRSSSSSASSGPDATAIDPGDGGAYEVQIDPARFSAVVDNPYLPLVPGEVFEFESRAADGSLEELIRVEVLDEHRQVMGVDTIVVHDVVTTPEGETIEDTYDWFAQDGEGAVWYFGEETTSFADGAPDTAGSWEAGTEGALPGIVMPAKPAVSSTGYRQEYLPGEAEDMGQVIAVGGSVEVPAGAFERTVVTRDWTPLEADVVEEKTFAPGVGLVFESKVSGEGTGETVVLVRHRPADG